MTGTYIVRHVPAHGFSSIVWTVTDSNVGRHVPLEDDFFVVELDDF